MNILVLHGPNLNLLGTRKPDIYGHETLAEVDAMIQAHARDRGAMATCIQSNSEGEIIDLIHEYCHELTGELYHDALIINPAAFTHYSIAIRDAIEAVEVPTVEVHLSNIAEREEFRRVSVIAPVCAHQIAGHGVKSYLMAIDVLVDRVH